MERQEQNQQGIHLQEAPVREDHSHEKEMEIDLKALFYRLLENARWIIVAAIAGAILLFAHANWIVTPMYQATSKLYIVNSKDSAINLSDLQIGSYLANDYQEIFNAWEVHEMVMQNLNLNYSYSYMQSHLTIANPADTRILHLTFSSSNPKEAMDVANEYANVAMKYIAETMATEIPSLLSSALLPTSPYSPQKSRNAILGFLLGALLVVAIVVIRFILDDKVKTSDEIQRYIGLPVLSVVPGDGNSVSKKQKTKKPQRG